MVDDYLKTKLNNASMFAILNAMGKGMVSMPYTPKPSKSYIPAGPKCNVKGTFVNNFKQTENINKIFNLWNNARIRRQTNEFT